MSTLKNTRRVFTTTNKQRFIDLWQPIAGLNGQ